MSQLARRVDRLEESAGIDDAHSLRIIDVWIVTPNSDYTWRHQRIYLHTTDRNYGELWFSEAGEIIRIEGVVPESKLEGLLVNVAA